MIFSDGNEFIDPISGDIMSWIEQFSVWTQRVFFTLEHGLALLAEQINSEKWRGIDATDFSKFPVIYNNFIDASSGQILVISLDIGKIFLNKTKDFTKLKILSFEPKNLDKASYIIDGFIRLEKRNSWKDYRVYAAIIDLKNKTPIAMVKYGYIRG